MEPTLEGNECYKFSTISNYIRQTGSKPIRVAIDCGANVGNVTALMLDYFPEARIYAFEPVQIYFEMTRHRFVNEPRVTVCNGAITYLHLYEDELGTRPREVEDPLAVFFGRLDTLGYGGMVVSTVGGSHDVRDPREFVKLGPPAVRFTLDEVVQRVLSETGQSELDYVKFDCEGCELSCLGCVSAETLSRIRFISGEYHNIAAFNRVIKKTLMATHRVNLIGASSGGAFFCERNDLSPGILCERDPALTYVRPWLCEETIGWEPFKPDYVLPHERGMHSLE